MESQAFNCPPDCGGILITGTARPLIQNSTITNSFAPAGGGLYAHYGSPLTLINVDVLSNTGGGAFARESAILVGGRFEGNDNLGGLGGGLYVSNTTICSSAT